MTEEKQATDKKPDRRTHSPADITRVTGLGKNRVYDLLHSGDIPSIKAGNRFLVPDSVLDQWLSTCGGKINVNA